MQRSVVPATFGLIVDDCILPKDLYFLCVNKPQGQFLQLQVLTPYFNFCAFTFGHKVTMALPEKGLY